MKRVVTAFSSLPPAVAFTIGMALLVLVGLLDLLTGDELSFSIFFLIPVISITWQLNFKAGLFACLMAAIAWLMAEQIGGRAYSNELIPYWNAVVRFGFFVIVAALISRVKNAAEIEGELARTDALTGIANSRYFYEMSHLEIERCRRTRRPLTVAYMDIDNFKQVNDTMGHSRGDELLRHVANEMSRQLRNTDLAARLGGDEFALLLVETSQEQARQVVTRLYDHLSSEMQDKSWPAGFSFGVATFVTAPDSIDNMLQEADALMYQAKHSTNGRIFFHQYD